MKQLVVEKTQAGTRLDVFLTKQSNEPLPRNRFKKLIQNKEVLVNGKIMRPSYRIKENDLITLNEEELKVDVLRKVYKKLEIIYEDADIIVINKPAEIATHPQPFLKEETLVNYLLAYYPQLMGVGEDPLRPGIVHRLDKAASGLIVIAKNEDAFIFLKDAWRKGVVKKRYYALVWGVVKEGGAVEKHLKRSKRSGRMVVSNEEGKRAITLYNVLKSYTNATLLDITTLTGRTHQIRAHLKSIGHPIIGDSLYRYKKGKKALSRLFLHAYYLKLPLPSGEEKTFQIDLPKELQEFLQRLKEKK